MLPQDAKNIASPIWRICNLYSIKDKRGDTVPFRPNKQQKRVLRAIFIEKKKKLFIPKARQLGMSTLVAIIILDALLFGSGVQCSISDFVSGNAKKKLEGKIFFAFSKLPDEIKLSYEIVTHNKQQGEFRIKRVGADNSDESVVYAGDKPRGDTYQILHLSELGETQVKAPERAKETIEGSLETAELGLVIIETTWHGGKVGQLYALVEEAMETADEKKDLDRDYFILFFAWWEAREYRSNGDLSQITPDIREYFRVLKEKLLAQGLVKEGFEFDEHQMLWYQKKKRRLGVRIYSVYPSLLEEIFLSPVEGAILAREIDQARIDGRVTDCPWDPSLPVNTIWDIGAPINTVVRYFQRKGGMFRFIDTDVIKDQDTKEINGLDMTFPERVRHMNAKPYQYGTHYLPHDGGSRDLRDRTTTQQALIGLGLRGTITVVPVTRDKWVSINHMKSMFPTFIFDKSLTDDLEGLAAYRLRPDPTNAKRFLDEPMHDWASHLADCLRTLAEASLKGYISEMDDTIETNLVIADEDIKRMSTLALKSIPSIGIVNSSSITFQANASGWMNKFEEPTFGSYYICVMYNDAIQVWRQRDTKRKQDRLAASLRIIGRIDQDRQIELASLMAKLYGDCLVVPVINDREGIIRGLMDAGCRIFMREVIDSKKPIGRTRPARKPGFDLCPVMRESVISDFVRAVRDGSCIIEDPSVLSQAGTFIVYEDGCRKAQEGYSDTHIIASAIAISTMGAATEMMLPGEYNSVVTDE